MNEVQPAYAPSSDIPGATVVPSHMKRRGTAPKLSLVNAEIEPGHSVTYDNGIYNLLAAGTMRGQPDEAIMQAAAEMTRLVKDGKRTMEEIVASQKPAPVAPSNQVENPPEPRPDHVHPIMPSGPGEHSQSLGPTAPPPPAPVQAPTQPAAPEFYLPTIRVKFKGPFGEQTSRYHNVEDCGEFLVLIFDKRCKIVDVYVPPVLDVPIEVSVAKEGQAATRYHALSMGVSLDLQSRDIHLLALMVVPETHPMLQPPQEAEDITGQLPASPFPGGM